MALATGLGGINVGSNLGQPLKAQIELVAVEKADRSSISARLASADAFKNAGIDYPYALPKLKFEVLDRDSGVPYIKVTSVQPINEPFVTLLVELTWSSGKLLREYTFLLDPVDFTVQEPRQAEAVRPIAPAAQVAPAPVAAPVPQVVEAPAAPVAAPVEPALAPTPAAPAPAEEIPQAETAAQPAATAPEQLEELGAAMEQPQAAEEEAAPASAEAESAVEEEAASEVAGKEEAASEVAGEENPFMVVRGDTLSSIALNVKPADVSLERMLVALYRANPDLFVAKNMNRLKTGKIIRLPDPEEVEAIQQSEAVKVVRAHTADWNAYRQRLAAVQPAPAREEVKQESSGKVSAAVAERTLVGKEAPKEVLKLSKGEAPSDKIVGGGKASAKEQAIAKEEEAIAKSKALKEAEERTALLEKNVSDLKRLADLKQSGAAGQPAASAPTAATGAGAAVASQVAAASQPAAAAPKKAPVPAPVPVPPPAPAPETSLLDDLLADPVMLAGGAAVLVLLGAGGLLLARRRRSAGVAGEESVPEDVGGATGRMTAPIAPSPETGDFTNAAQAETPAHAKEEEVDPIGEADLFLTFGRDAQAEEVLKEALKVNPGHLPVKLKLLSIYANRKDTKSFYTYAREIKDSGDEAAWTQAASMGRELEPSNPFYGGTGISAAPAAEQKAEAPTVDFDLGFGAPAAPAPEASMQSTVVVEAVPQEATAVLSQEEFKAVQETPMDFDVTGTHVGDATAQSPEATVSVNMDEMVFDVTTTHPGTPAAAATPAPTESILGDLVFDITSNRPELTPAAPPAPAPAADEGLTFTLDFPSSPAATAAPKAEKPLDIGLGEISLNLEGLTPSGAASSTESKSEQWQEVATKLDLAKAYQEMGDAAGAKEILDEVLRDGDEQQRALAQAMIQQL